MEQILFIGSILLLIGVSWFILKVTQAPSVTGVSSSLPVQEERQGKRVRITLVQLLLFKNHPLRPFRHCPTTDGCILLAHAMHPLLQRAPVEFYRNWLIATGQHPTIAPYHEKGTTDYTLHITHGAILYTMHQHSYRLTWDTAQYLLLCTFYRDLTQPIELPVIEEPVSAVQESMEEPLIITEPVLVAAMPLMIEQEEEEERVEEPVLVSYTPAYYSTRTQKISEPDLTLNEYLKLGDQDAFREAMRYKLRALYLSYCQEKKITQELIVTLQKILTRGEWVLLMQAGKGILWEVGVVERIEGDTIINVEPDDLFSLVDQYILAHWHEI